jgi:hypothetical protein
VKTKTAYRVKPEKPADNPPAVVTVAAPTPDAPEIIAVDTAYTEPQPESQPDEAAAALQHQINELRRSEALQRQAAEYALRYQQSQQPPGRETKLAAWR